jgi:cytochrome c oxidase assembly protein subunit 15
MPIPFQALVAIHWTHRVFALAAAGALAWLVWRARAHDGTQRMSAWLAVLLVVQLVTGTSNVIFQWPLFLAVLHNGGAAAMLALVVALNYRAWQARTNPAAVRPPEAATRAAE